MIINGQEDFWPHPLHYGDYVRLAATETEFARSPAEVDRLVTAALAENSANLDGNAKVRPENAGHMLHKAD